ncbi:putative EPIDERMAL PATTERNING FACTOR-like protein [Helianthus annuus]|nr:putative EPIDERMAL PATTERNING FACTOR-like protein [Helianthus annuus]KAJ0825348.1 putative EPIDERMAL PATTERNING FACTOR-like protein [Helianthus annuus]
MIMTCHKIHQYKRHVHHHQNQVTPYHHGATGVAPGKQRAANTVQVPGSRLPDCTHACGSCSPCKLVMVSFVCASIEEAETCPMAYKCMCKNKSYPVP